MVDYDLTLPDWTVERAYKQQRDNGAYDKIADKYHDPMTAYAFQVLEGTTMAGKDIKLACWRHLQDLTRIGQADFPYHYSLDKCHEVLNFASICPDVDTGKPLPLMLWQKALLCSSQGWRNEKGERRFHRVQFSVARTNGKTYITNILLAYDYLIASDGMYNQDLGYIAPVVAQSKKGWRYIQLTFDRLGELTDVKRTYKTQQIKTLDDVVRSKKTRNQLLRLSHESGQFDSYHFRLAVADESGDDGRIGTIKENIGKITSGQVQVYDHQFWSISTAYPDSTSSFYLDEKLAREAMQKDYSRELDDVLLINYSQDSEDEVDDPSSWTKSNPILELKKDTMLPSLVSERDKKKLDGTLDEFKNKNLNMWIKASDNRYLNIHDIENAVADKPPFSISGHDVYIGFDLSKLADDTAVAFIYPYQLAGETHYYIQQHSWVPLSHTGGSIAEKEKQDGINYRQAEQLGFATIAKGRFGYIDEDSVTTWIMDYIEENGLNVKFFVFDRWGTSDVLDKLSQEEPFPLMPLKQTSDKLDKPTHEFKKAIREGRVHYDDDPILKYALTNAVIVGSSAGIKVDKDRATSKIDAVDAVIDAFSRAYYAFSDFDPDADNDKNRSPLSGMSDEERHKFLMNVGF
ncbi:terminase large subunit [Lacticaseibacillus paracasei]|uniref:terminase large subunit n=1 Tax=Lacticaseibacillus paracasei TaxID=1597 RepID=UPI000F0B36CB|nr:terminase TerL endonuclease subunit [Lacticaseibacillus paracasei]MDE3291303.1 terminase large subunit [Lacticaseibacillus paracasei]RNE25084.1 Phage terminase-like protein, large subunit [Lacticaseibacillus paracasei]